MADKARVTSIEALEVFRPSLIKFTEETSTALLGAEADAGRTAQWLRGEMIPYWKKEVRIRQEDVTRAKSKLTVKQAQKDDDQRVTVDERKAVEKAKRRLVEAEEKFTRSRAWARRLEKAQDDFRGAIGSFKTIVEHEMPKAIARLDHSIATLDAYTKMKPKSAPGGTRRAGPQASEGGAP
ncbi:MAG: hypothetical protein AAF297_01305 [Planctomycetota bacterium]